MKQKKSGKEPWYGEIPLSKISDDEKFMTRSTIEVEDLKKSIAQIGQQVPVILRRKGEGFENVAGDRRIRSQRELGAETVKALVYEVLSDVEAYKISIAENIEHKSLSQLEIVNACKRLKEEKLKIEDICTAFGKKTRTIQRYLVVADAEPEIKRALGEDRITILQAYEIIKRGIRLSDFLTNRYSIRRLRQMSKDPKSKPTPVKTQWFKNGNLNLTVRFKSHLHNKTDLIQTLREIMKRLGKHENS